MDRLFWGIVIENNSFLLESQDQVGISLFEPRTTIIRDNKFSLTKPGRIVELLSPGENNLLNLMKRIL